MKLFLTSSPSGPLDQPNDDRVLDNTNLFVEHLKSYWKKQMKGLMICANPYSFDSNDEMTQFFYDAFFNSDVPVESFDIWDNRMIHYSKEELFKYDIIVLAGGHVPTQNAYFNKIHLKEMIQGFQGIVIGISAGTMNCATIVYAQPELENESIDPNYKRFIPGLGLCELNICPHYQMIKNNLLDGKRLFEDITYSDSFGHKFYALLDGSYIFVHNRKVKLYGEGYCIQDGRLEKICENNQIVILKN